MSALEKIEFRVFVEGILVTDVSAVTVNLSKNEASSASITIPPPPGFHFEDLVRARVHVFWSNRKIRRTRSVGEWPILFEGEVIGDGFTKTPQSRDVTFDCLGLHSYWEQILYYFFDFSQAAFARWAHSDRIRIFLGNDSVETNANVAGLDLQSRIKSIVSEELEKPYPSIVRRMFDEGLTSNHFFELANKALRLSDRFIATKDRNLKKLINNNLFLSLVDQHVVAIDGQQSLMKVLQVMMNLFRYQVINNAQPRLVRASKDKKRDAAQVARTTAEQEHRLIDFGNTIDITIKSLADVSLDENSTDEEIAVNAKAKVETESSAKIQAGASDDETDIEDKTSSLTTIMIEIRDRLKQSGDERRTLEDEFLDKNDILSQFMFLPDTRWVAPPACNVIFPSDQTSYGMRRNHLQEPTRYMMILRDIAGLQVGQPFYYAPSIVPVPEASIANATVPELTVESSNPRGWSPPVQGPFRIVRGPRGFRSPDLSKKGADRIALVKHANSSRKKYHNGVDIGSNVGVSIRRRPILAMDDGIVKVANSTGTVGGKEIANGKYVSVQFDNGIRWIGIHMDEVKVRAGDRVTGGKTVLGLVGNTGKKKDGTPSSFGDHLHMEMRVGGKLVDPSPFIVDGIMNSSSLDDARTKFNLKKHPFAARLLEGALSSAEAGQERDVPSATREENIKEAADNDSTFKDYEFLTPEEKIKGIIPYFDYNFDPVLALVDADVSFDKDTYIQSLVESEFLFRKFESRQVNPVNGPFNPFPMPGFPGLIVNKDRSIIGKIGSMSHTLVASGAANTTVQMEHPRYWDEGDPYHWKNGVPSADKFVFPNYFLDDVIDTNSYDTDPSDSESSEHFGVGRDRPADRVYQTLLGCSAIPYFYGERTSPITGMTVAYNKAIGSDEKSAENTIVGRYYSLLAKNFETAVEFASAFTERLGASESEIFVTFLGCTAGAGNIEYTGAPFRSEIQGAVRTLTAILGSRDAFRG